MLEAVIVVAAVCESLVVAAAIFELQGAQVVTVAIEEALDGTAVTVATLEPLVAEVVVTVIWESM